jgi:hypothetical protein
MPLGCWDSAQTKPSDGVRKHENIFREVWSIGPFSDELKSTSFRTKTKSLD